MTEVLVLEEPKEEEAGIAIDKRNVYHCINGLWIKCGDCKIKDKYIQELLK